MARTSAGLVLYAIDDDDDGGVVRVLIVHPGGPFWARKDTAAWSIPKGEYGDADDPHAAALREFEEELGSPPPPGDDIALGEIRQAGGKRVMAWARPGDFDAAGAVSNSFDLEWPPRSGRIQQFPEVDRAAWFVVEEARAKVLVGQIELLDRLMEALRVTRPDVRERDA